MPNVSNDLSQKLYATMEKHKEVRGSHQGRRMWQGKWGSKLLTPTDMVTTSGCWKFGGKKWLDWDEESMHIEFALKSVL